ncbi:hypothetical protein [Ponticoccus alexandrii]|uniref:DNA cytosine methyltransferase n=1 Tax=Ponticoccus alexandrii TaxID=1943633 RepID=A0ABX7F7V2_9RHOB|nr:hypothetical protein [Ponticoccus alexandrii]ETA53998.1 hypothetical protein P279_00175 [Rhodobacteraceae bacterium PD-2]QRF66347.1 hypothetical protein GQA70_08520 [Ponticoccus alexandrii]
MTALRVLIGCETSGIARRAFLARGFDAWSCDLLPAEDQTNRHITGDVRDILGDGWDLLCVMHPPCTRLCRSGRRWLSGPGKMTPPKVLPKGRTWPDMIAEFESGVDLFRACWNAPVEHVAIENPAMHDLARDRMPEDLPAPHIVQPHWFGEKAYKDTGWYLRRLPRLRPTDRLPEPPRGSDEWKRWNRVHRMPPGPDRARLRSRSFPGMMDAAAAQWGDFAQQEKAAA